VFGKAWWALAYFGDLSALASRLRADGLDARNLGQVGITLWDEESGHFFPVSELEENAELVMQRDFNAILKRRTGNNGQRSRPDLRLAS
jgi:hypothetical protein